MSANQLRRKAEDADRRARRAALVSAAIAIALFGWFGWAFSRFPSTFQSFQTGSLGWWSMRLGFGLLSLWSLYSGYKTYQVLWPRSGAADADLKTTLQSYLQLLEKRRDYSANIWLRSGLIGCFLGMAMVVTPMLVRDASAPLKMLESVGPVLALFTLWLAIFIPQRRRRQRKLQQEIDHLRAFEREWQA